MKKSTIILICVAVFLVLYVGGGCLSLASQQESIHGQTGEVWNASQRAVEVLGRLENQMSVFLKDRQDLIDKITTARNDMLSAQKAEDLQALSLAQQNADLAIKAIFENYPSADLSDAQLALMDETAGSINRIAYARSKLIDAQVGYNKTRIGFFISGIFFPRIEVLGENADPAATLPASSFGK